MRDWDIAEEWKEVREDSDNYRKEQLEEIDNDRI